VDYDQCETNGLCVAAAPEVFEIDDDDQMVVLIEHPSPDLQAKVDEAVRLCPKQALSVERD
jgi:ferredoxin